MLIEAISSISNHHHHHHHYHVSDCLPILVIFALFKPAFLISKSRILKTNVCHLPQPLDITSIMVQLKRFLPSRKTITLSTTSSLLIELLNRVSYDDIDGKSFIGYDNDDDNGDYDGNWDRSSPFLFS